MKAVATSPKSLCSAAMNTRGPRYSKQEFARRGDEIYEREVSALVEPDHRGEFVAIDIEAGAFEVGPHELSACDRLRAKYPDAQSWLVRIGSRHLHRFGRGSG